MRSLQANLLTVQNDFQQLNSKTDHILGNLSYVANEYDDFSKKLTNLNQKNQSMNKTMNFFYENFKRLDEKSTKIEEELEKLEQYGRRENIEIHGIPQTEHESTKEIVKRWLKL